VKFKSVAQDGVRASAGAAQEREERIAAALARLPELAAIK
jgi:hypothetical protein